MSKEWEDQHDVDVKAALNLKVMLSKSADETIDTIRENAVDLMGNDDYEVMLSEGEAIANVEQFIHAMNAIDPVWWESLIHGLMCTNVDK